MVTIYNITTAPSSLNIRLIAISFNKKKKNYTKTVSVKNDRGVTSKKKINDSRKVMLVIIVVLAESKHRIISCYCVVQLYSVKQTLIGVFLK